MEKKFEDLRKVGSRLYKDIKEKIKKESETEDEWFYLNRFVYARLQLDEKMGKRKIKKELFHKNPFCYLCKKKFESMRGVEVHRKDNQRGYSESNCVLLHRECHEKIHSKKESIINCL
jgi:hypothetical protein